MTKIVGTPRKKSTYTVHMIRTGKATGARRPLPRAISSDRINMKNSATKKILMLSTKALISVGHAATASSRLKKVSWTLGQPGDAVTR